MRKLYDEFFGIPENGKIREKVMIARVVLTVAIMVGCLVAMSMTAYAYFSHEVTTSNNIIKGAEFSIQLEIDGKTAEDGAYNVINSKTFEASFVAGKEYTVKVTHSGDATTGFCTVYAEKCINGIYHTQQVFKENGKNVITFTLQTTKDTDVTFTAHWGTSSKYTEFGSQGANGVLYIENGEDVEMPIENTLIMASPKPDTSNKNELDNKDESVDESSNDNSEESNEESQPTVNEKGEIIHIVKTGESLSRIGDLYDRSSRDLAYYNELENPDSIEVGQVILIPPEDWKRPKDNTEASKDESATDVSSVTESSTDEASTENSES